MNGHSILDDVKYFSEEDGSQKYFVFQAVF